MGNDREEPREEGGDDFAGTDHGMRRWGCEFGTVEMSPGTIP